MIVNAKMPPPSPAGEPQLGAKKQWWRSSALLVASFVVPLMLCVPAVIWLQYDARGSRNASAILTQQIKALEPQIADIKDINRVREEFLSRKEILKVLDTYAPRSGDVLGIAGALPSGVLLRSVVMKDEEIVFEILCAGSSQEYALLDLLKQRGFRDPQVSSRSNEGDDASERLTIHASSGRGVRE